MGELLSLRDLMRINILFILLFSIIQNLHAANSLSYSGRLVQASGAPITGPVNLRAELVYTNATSTVQCSQNLTSVALTKGVFHLKLDLNCTPKTLTQVLSETPNGESVAIRIIDQTNSKTYPLQAIHSVPFSKVAEQLPQMGASAGQALAWDGSKWAPTSVGTGNGTVMSVTAGTGLSGGTITTTGTIGIAAGGITSAELANNSVTAAKINAGEITSTHISATANIPYSKLQIGVGEIPQDRINGLAGSMSALIEDVIADAVTGKAPSQNAVFDALNLKADRSNVAQNITAASVTGLVAPIAGSDAANKTYVDNSATTLDTRITNEVATLNTALGNKYDKAGGVITGDMTLNTQMLLKGGANFVTLKANSGTASYVMTLPTSAGTNGYVLRTDGAGVLSWVDPTSIASGIATVDSNSITDGSIIDADINASANIAQSKIAGLTTDLSNKEPSITSGTATQYWRGNKTWSSLQADVQALILNNYTLGLNSAVVSTDSLSVAIGKLQGQINATNTTIGSLTTTNISEGTRLYFTEPRVQQTLLTGLNTSLTGQISAGDNVLQAFGRTQKQINDINTSISGNQWLASGSNLYRSSGRVGIGTNPSGTLDVSGGTAASGDGEDIFLRAQNAGTDSNGGDIHLLTGVKNGTGARNGRVTIGPSFPMGTPPYELTLVTNSNSYPYSIGIPDSAGYGVSLLISASSAGSNSSGWSGGDVTIRGGNTYGGSGSSKIIFQTAGGGTAGTLQTATTKMTITGTGEVGIGTPIPAAKLHVAGAIKMGPDAGLTCSGTTAGAMRFTSPNVEYCNGTSWVTFGQANEAITSSVITDGTIVDADINASANIAQSKISGLTTDLSNKQPLDATLSALAGLDALTGLVVQNGTDTFIKRSIAGTANRLNVTNGDGISGNPTLNIDTNLLPSPMSGGMFLKSTAANSSAWSAITSGEITSALGFTPVSKSGDTVSSGNFVFNGSSILSVPNPINLTDAVNKQYVDNAIGAATQSQVWFHVSDGAYATPAATANLQIDMGKVYTSGAASFNPSVNQGGHTPGVNGFNTTTGTFKPPISGRYFFQAQASVTMTNGFIAIRKNGSIHAQAMMYEGTADWESSSVSAVIDVTTADTITFIYFATNGLTIGQTYNYQINGFLIPSQSVIDAKYVAGTAADANKFLKLDTDGQTIKSTSALYENGSYVGIGTTTPSTALTIQGTGGSNDDVYLDSFSDTQEGAIMLRRARGTSAAPTTLLSGDRVGLVTFRGYNGTAYSDLARMQATTEADLNTAASAALQFFTTNAGVNTEKMRISAAGKVGINHSIPMGRLHVAGGLYEKNVNASTAYGMSDFIVQGNGTTKSLTKGPTLSFALPANNDGTNHWEMGRILVTPDSTGDSNAAGSMHLQTRYNNGTDWSWRNSMSISSGGTTMFEGTGGGVLSIRSTLASTDHAYFQIFADAHNPTVRSAWIGYGATGTSTLTMVNEMNGVLALGTNGVSTLTLSPGGNATLTGTLTQSSDKRLKKNISKLNYGLKEVLKLEPKSYILKSSDEKSMGFIAQDVEEIMPELVKTNDDGFKSLAYSLMPAVIVNAIKEQQQIILQNKNISELMRNSVIKIEKEISKQNRKIANVNDELKEKESRIQKLELENQMMKAYLCTKDPKAPFCR